MLRRTGSTSFAGWPRARPPAGNRHDSGCNSTGIGDEGGASESAARTLRLPQLDSVPLGIAQLREPPIRVHLRIHLPRDPLAPELPHHRVEIAHPEVDHPRLRHVAEERGVRREGREHGEPGFLTPRFLLVVLGRFCDAQVLLVPGREPLGIRRAKEEAAEGSRRPPAAEGLMSADGLRPAPAGCRPMPGQGVRRWTPDSVWAWFLLEGEMAPLTIPESRFIFKGPSFQRSPLHAERIPRGALRARRRDD